MTITRHYGETAAEKSNELLFHMAIAVMSVTALIWLTLGLRGRALCSCYSCDPGSDADGVLPLRLYAEPDHTICAHLPLESWLTTLLWWSKTLCATPGLRRTTNGSLVEVALEAVDEVGNPTILATCAVIAAIVPMAFVRGLMGPYMRPIPIGASAAMIFSLLVAFIVTPWASIRLLKRHKSSSGAEGHEQEDWSTRLYRRLMNPLIHSAPLRWAFLIGVTVLLCLSASLVYFKWSL
jgi:multidrug efflux pump subunit AcrB